jgi:hypothetical protein
VSHLDRLGRPIFDVAILRPMGLFQLIMSSVAFVPFYPLSLVVGGSDAVVEICITQPAERVFGKPLGEL